MPDAPPVNPPEAYCKIAESAEILYESAQPALVPVDAPGKFTKMDNRCVHLIEAYGFRNGPELEEIREDSVAGIIRAVEERDRLLRNLEGDKAI